MEYELEKSIEISLSMFMDGDLITEDDSITDQVNFTMVCDTGYDEEYDIMTPKIDEKSLNLVLEKIKASIIKAIEKYSDNAYDDWEQEFKERKIAAEEYEAESRWETRMLQRGE